MSNLSLTGEEMLAWNESTTAQWKTLCSEHPEMLDLPCDINGTKSVAELLQHIVAVELRYAERLANLPVRDYAAIPYHSVEAVFATHEEAMSLYRKLLASDIDWNETIEYMTRVMGPARSLRKTIFVHALMHSIRHYAQLATLVRQHGIKPSRPLDYLFMDIERA
jgi:uncharacterized damage-inducible protein DinB